MRVLSAMVAVGCLTGAWAGLPSAAEAEGATVVVRSFSGRGSARVRGAVIKALKEQSVSFVDTSDVDDAADRLGVDPERPAGRVAISRELGISTWILGKVERDGKLFVANIDFVDGSTGESLGLMSFEGRNPRALSRETGGRLWSDASDLVMAGQVPEAAPAPMPATSGGGEDEQADGEGGRRRWQSGAPLRDDIDEEDDDGDASDGGGPSPLDAEVAMVGFSRDFSYNDDLSGLRAYDLTMAPAVALRVHWYPIAHGGGDGIGSNIGLDLRGRFAFLVDSALDDTTFPTSSRALGVGVRWRIPIDRSEVGLVVGYANHTFAIDPVNDEDRGEIVPGVPSAEYEMLRVGADTRIAVVDEWSIGLGVAYLPTLGIGELEEWFPNASVTALEAEASLIHELSSNIDVRLGLGFQRFAFTLDPSLEDAQAGEPIPIAGGALDQYLSGELALRAAL